MYYSFQLVVFCLNLFMVNIFQNVRVANVFIFFILNICLSLFVSKFYNGRNVCKNDPKTFQKRYKNKSCLLYTSDAADE